MAVAPIERDKGFNLVRFYPMNPRRVGQYKVPLVDIDPDHCRADTPVVKILSDGFARLKVLLAL